LLIRAVKGNGSRAEQARLEYEAFRDFLSVDPYMDREWSLSRAGS
jgi:hypothetical protein